MVFGPPVQPPLLLITATIGRSCRTIVSNSCTFIRNEPSPIKATTWRPGAAAFAPIAKGIPVPMQPFGPELSRPPSANAGIHCRPKFSVSMPSMQMIASRSTVLTISLAMRSGWIGVASDSAISSVR